MLHRRRTCRGKPRKGRRRKYGGFHDGDETLPAPGHIVCLLSPAKGKARYRGCMKAVSNHRGMSIDCRTVIFLFGSDGLNNEHIKL